MVSSLLVMKMCFKLDELLSRLFIIFFTPKNGIQKSWKQKLFDEKSKHEIWIEKDKTIARLRLHRVQLSTNKHLSRSKDQKRNKNLFHHNHQESIIFWRKVKVKELIIKHLKRNQTHQGSRANFMIIKNKINRKSKSSTISSLLNPESIAGTLKTKLEEAQKLSTSLQARKETKLNQNLTLEMKFLNCLSNLKAHT